MSNRHLQGIGFAEQCREVGERLEREFEEAKWRNHDDRAAPDPTHTYCRTHIDLSTGMWTAETIDELPFTGRVQARGRNKQHAINELRIVRAWALHKKLGIDWDTARQHATRYVHVEITE